MRTTIGTGANVQPEGKNSNKILAYFVIFLKFVSFPEKAKLAYPNLALTGTGNNSELAFITFIRNISFFFEKFELKHLETNLALT